MRTSGSFPNFKLAIHKHCRFQYLTNGRVSIRADLAQTKLVFCSKHVPAIFSDNFDYQHTNDFVKGESALDYGQGSRDSDSKATGNLSVNALSKIGQKSNPKATSRRMLNLLIFSPHRNHRARGHHDELDLHSRSDRFLRGLHHEHDLV